MASLPNALANPSTTLLLPPGRLLDATTDGPWHEPLLWCADAPASVGDWASLRATGRDLGLLPVLLDVGTRQSTPDVWDLDPGGTSYPGDHDAFEVLDGYWADFAAVQDDPDEADASLDAWQGLAPATAPRADPDGDAADTADFLAEGVPWLKELRPALVPARRSADIPAAIGWTGPLNHENDVARLCAVLRSWEDRFGARVVVLTFDQLVLSVASPPTTPEHAEAVAAEHYAFCPDNIGQGIAPLGRYAEEAVRNSHVWSFWWD
ncbi:DUF4253 domain-containing protein [Streptomyces sp. UH6]|uniref:DUF4253 domain-containing protein n=1 Tax=Streptomyces sp. UH6 TaxID=2748379 RepID=UPI0015D4CEF5|nr:DUF4253 domain-containing protein [Streptomyces sp. UH6]NYV76995.1 DUF4253 domain-containing protein [Streptomyces sp. UH6]